MCLPDTKGITKGRDSDGSLSFSSFSYLSGIVALYVLSGCCQPIMMESLKGAGLADPKCQLYMLFYYFGTASAIFLLRLEQTEWPPARTVLKTSCVVLFDIVAQMMNYTGASLAGPTIFAIIYSSVTAWAALYSQLILGRRMNARQWFAVCTVFVGLSLTVTDTCELGPEVLHGLVLVFVGSSMHGLFYVMSEAVMIVGEEKISVSQTCALQGATAALAFFLWQVFYTVPRFDVKIWEPMQESGTTLLAGLSLLGVFAIISFVHSITFFHTLRHFPGGATSAGVFKGLQAVLVFVFTDWIYCGRVGGEEMCFSRIKFFSLVTVSGGVAFYGIATKEREKNTSRGYEEIGEADTIINIE